MKSIYMTPTSQLEASDLTPFIAIVRGTPVKVTRHAQHRFFERTCCGARSLRSSRERLEAKLAVGRVSDRDPYWGCHQEEGGLWLHLGPKAAMPCVEVNGMLRAKTCLVLPRLLIENVGVAQRIRSF
jgi:hypothetical protein